MVTTSGPLMMTSLAWSSLDASLYVVVVSLSTRVSSACLRATLPIDYHDFYCWFIVVAYLLLLINKIPSKRLTIYRCPFITCVASTTGRTSDIALIDVDVASGSEWNLESLRFDYYYYIQLLFIYIVIVDNDALFVCINKLNWRMRMHANCFSACSNLPLVCHCKRITNIAHWLQLCEWHNKSFSQ